VALPLIPIAVSAIRTTRQELLSSSFLRPSSGVYQGMGLRIRRPFLEAESGDPFVKQAHSQQARSGDFLSRSWSLICNSCDGGAGESPVLDLLDGILI